MLIVKHNKFYNICANSHMLIGLELLPVRVQTMKMTQFKKKFASIFSAGKMSNEELPSLYLDIKEDVKDEELVMEAEKVEQKPQELPRFILLGKDELQKILAGTEAGKTPRGTQSGLSKLLKIKKTHSVHFSLPCEWKMLYTKGK